MKRSKFSERQIVGVLKQAEAGVPVKDLCRKLGISDQTFYNWSRLTRSHPRSFLSKARLNRASSRAGA
jgi:putative transposase